MKIGIDGTALTIPFYCGVRHYAENLIGALSRVDTENEYVIFLPRKQVVPIPDRFRIVWLPAVPFLKRQLFLPMAVARESVEIFHYLEPYGSVLLQHPKIVTTVHDNNLAMTYPWKSRFFLNRLHCEVSRKVVYGRTRTFVAVSQFVADETERLFPSSVNGAWVVVNPNGYDRQTFRNPKKMKSGNYFLTMGDFTPRKNVHRVLAAFADYIGTHEKSRLIVVTSRQMFADGFLSTIRELGIDQMVDFAIGVTHEELAGLYREAQAFIYPSLYEGFGLPIIEAMACGCPVITSNIGAMKETARGGAILVDPYSVSSIRAGMQRIDDRDLRKKYIEKGLLIAGAYSWERHAQNMIDIYKTA